MHQTCDTPIFSRPILKDKAKGALYGKFGKAILAFFLVAVITFIAETAVEMMASILLSTFIISKEMLVNNLTLEQIELLVQDTSYMHQYMVWYLPIDYLLLTITNIFTSVLNAGLAYFCLNIACGQTARVSDIFYGYKKHFHKSLKIGALFILLSQLIQIPTATINYMNSYVENISTEVGIILLVALLIGTLAYSLLYLGISQTFFLLLDFPGYSAKELIKLSIHIMKGHKLRFFLLELSFLPLIMLSLLTFCIGDLWLTPYMQLTYTFFFLNLMQTRQKTQ